MAPADLTTVGLQVDRPLRGERFGAVPEVFHDRILHDRLIVQPDPGARSELADFESIPLNNTIVLRRQEMWRCINILKNDKFMKKYVLW
jgi:hypothetical protein